MGAPAENKTYQQIIDLYGEITDFSGSGTDDSALKHILCDAIERAQGYPTADDWAEAWMDQKEAFARVSLDPVMNTFWKVGAEGIAPRDAGLGNMASSSSAMCISPMGMINAGNPRQAALESAPRAGRAGGCPSQLRARWGLQYGSGGRGGLLPGRFVDPILNAAVEYLPRRSAKVQVRLHGSHPGAGARNRRVCGIPRRYYAGRILPGIAMPDARDGPRGLSLFYLANGDPRQTILYGANFGRDADTIASMASPLAGALHGATLCQASGSKIRASGRRDQSALTAMLVEVIRRRAEDMKRVIEGMEGLSKNRVRKSFVILNAARRRLVHRLPAGFQDLLEAFEIGLLHRVCIDRRGSVRRAEIGGRRAFQPLHHR